MNLSDNTENRRMAQTPRHIIFIGETGSGKSSVINLIADHDLATTSPDANPCTRTSTPYDVTIGRRTYRLWDTPGLDEPSTFARWFGLTTPVTKSVKKFLEERRRRGELDLLVFCVRQNRASNAMSRAYRTFCDITRRTSPVMIVVTHLEKQQPTMDAWWQMNERELARLGFLFDGHACVTCLSPHHRRRTSREEVRHLISV